MSRIPQKQTPAKTPKTQLKIMSKQQGGMATPGPSSTGGRSLLQKRVFQEAMGKAALDPKKKVVASGIERSVGRPPKILTRKGPEEVLQQLVVETTVKRDPKAEHIQKVVKGVDVDPSGQARFLQLASHQIDPEHATESAGVCQVFSVTSGVSVTASGTQTKKSIKKKTIKNENLMGKINMNPAHVNRLVREESEDVDNTLKMVPPDLISTSIDKVPLKKKWQNLRLTSESMALLQESVMIPPPTADEIDVEAPPEALATIMSAVEHGATPKAPPNQIFNTLFPDVKEQRINVSSVAPGPLEDIVVPTSAPPKLTEEILIDEMQQILADKIQNAESLPQDDLATLNSIIAQSHTSKDLSQTPNMLSTEIPPWETSDIEDVGPIVGGDPIFTLENTDLSIFETTQDITQELAKGIDYFIDADTIPYETRVQIRGTRLPIWFPGYMSAFSHVPEIVRISKTPSEVLHTAWKAVQPKIFPDESILLA